LIQILRGEGVELWDPPKLLVEVSRRHSSKLKQRQKSVAYDETPDWFDYV